MREVVISSIVRTPIGKYCGSLREIPVFKLAALILNEELNKVKIKSSLIDDVILGQAYQNGECANLARFALLEAGWPVNITGVTLDRRCCSGLQSIWYGAMQIQTGNADFIVAGGAENMSQAEFYLPGDFIKWGIGGTFDSKHGFAPRGHGNLSLWGIPFYDRIQRARPMSQPIERFGELNSMMSWAEIAAEKENITREEADEWSIRSHQNAITAIDSGKFKDEIVPVLIPLKGRDEFIFNTDETPRRDTSLEKLAKLIPVYENGICTAGNSSTENDGAAAALLTSYGKAKELGLDILGCIKSFAVAADDPSITYTAVPLSVKKALDKAELKINDIELIEIQEAFACQALADAKMMGLSKEDCEKKVNVNGSGISLGHPIGATGTMRLATLLYEMKKREARYGLETICGGGGQAITIIVERKT